MTNRADASKLKVVMIVGVLSLFLLVGCGGRAENSHREDVFQVTFISSLPTNDVEEMEAYLYELLAEDLPEGISIQVQMTLPSFDRLTVELINKQADVVIVDDGLDQILIDPYYLAPLESIDGVNKQEFDRFVREDDRDGREHLYAVGYDEMSRLREDVPYELEYDLVAGVVATSPHQTLALNLIKKWL